ncbi:ABC transporter permease [Paenarthrobacter sp. JL.01a]|uniref:ABC transporter permease n=1 Tax=Paenarthrobacter sp. JL.01a TaxID=2979324 RepID=UPI0021CA6AD9|nr:ABC transporter permease [Paenarthrobacter sp. JL.01a]UXM91328.1 ABC transporter permease [Paenarthrobacter sp. JL.01a]
MKKPFEGLSAALDVRGRKTLSSRAVMLGRLPLLGPPNYCRRHGREFTDGTISGLFALPVRRTTIALAKLMVYAGWAIVMAVVLTMTLLGLGLVLGFGWPKLLNSKGCPGSSHSQCFRR